MSEREGGREGGREGDREGEWRVSEREGRKLYKLSSTM